MNISGLTDKQKVQKKGIAPKPVPMEIDIDAIEAELQRKLIEQATVDHASQDPFLKGRRLTGRNKLDLVAAH